jgi:hypothetical protein
VLALVVGVMGHHPGMTSPDGTVAVGRLGSSVAAAREKKTAGRQALATGSPDGLDLVQWRTVDGSLQVMRPSPGLLARRLWEAPPVRSGRQYQNRRDQYGLYFWAATGEHIRYESARRLAFLVQLDQQGGVVQIAARPCRLLFRTGATATFHDPAFLAEHASGDQVLYDMRAAGVITEKLRRRFDETLRVCRQVGWQYQVLTEPSPIRAGNLAFLRPARLSRCHPEPGVFEQLLGVFAAGRPVGQGAAMVNRGHPATVMPFVKHLIWHRRLMVDLDVRLDFDAVAVTDRGEGVPCCG